MSLQLRQYNQHSYSISPCTPFEPTCLEALLTILIQHPNQSKPHQYGSARLPLHISRNVTSSTTVRCQVILLFLEKVNPTDPRINPKPVVLADSLASRRIVRIQSTEEGLDILSSDCRRVNVSWTGSQGRYRNVALDWFDRCITIVLVPALSCRTIARFRAEDERRGGYVASSHFGCPFVSCKEHRVWRGGRRWSWKANHPI